jgi:phosphohistidine swiveling domain-containing protein
MHNMMNSEGGVMGPVTNDAIAIERNGLPRHESDAGLFSRESPDALIRAFGGGKGYQTYTLSLGGFNVPDWRIVSSESFRLFGDHDALESMIRQRLAGLEIETVREISAELLELLGGIDPPAEFRTLVETVWQELGPGALAVRSSGLVEDGEVHSFAGQYSSYLNLNTVDAVLEAARACWLSGFSERALFYHVQRRIPAEPFAIACLIQRMVPAEQSGVVFTNNPMTGETDLVVSAVVGVGEGLVSGELDADTIRVDRETGKPIETIIGDKCKAYVVDANGNGLVERDVDPSLAEKLCISQIELEGIVKTALQIEKKYGKPQDIEWCLKNGELYILQTRPITSATLKAGTKTSANYRIWDNSNIIESYGDITLPMTASFARSSYAGVFEEYAHILGIPRTELNGMRKFLRNMLGYHNGRVYYDLLNWYKMIRIAPFYSLNRKAMEISMGVQTPLHDDEASALDPYAGLRKYRRTYLKLKASIKFILYFFVIERVVNKFVDRFEVFHRRVDTLPVDEMDPVDIFSSFDEYRTEFTRQWGKTILLEQTISLCVGALMACIRSWMPNAPEMLLFQSIKPADDLQSMKPVIAMEELAGAIRSSPVLEDIFSTTPADDVVDRLSATDEHAARAFLSQFESYIASYGYRSFNELKLEEPDMHEDSSILVRMLYGAIPATAPVAAVGEGDSAKDYLRKNLNPVKRALFQLLRKKASRGLAARERTRFCRTKAFGTTRKMVRSIGSHLARMGYLHRSDDIFYLRIEELTGWFDGALNHSELPELVAIRRKQIEEARKFDGPPRFKTTGILSDEAYRLAGWRRLDSDMGDVGNSTILRGTPSCAGRVTGEAAVLSAPSNVGGKVMVTYKTDPGWCPVLPSASALLIERGSPLTHVAIVARELGIPTVTQISGLTRRVSDGMILIVDGEVGTVTLPEG